MCYVTPKELTIYTRGFILIDWYRRTHTLDADAMYLRIGIRFRRI
jgi:hypothetical protein